MASGEYISVANQNELVAAEAAVERDLARTLPGSGNWQSSLALGALAVGVAYTIGRLIGGAV